VTETMKERHDRYQRVCIEHGKEIGRLRDLLNDILGRYTLSRDMKAQESRVDQATFATWRVKAEPPKMVHLSSNTEHSGESSSPLL
jgi:hypothetical protein